MCGKIANILAKRFSDNLLSYEYADYSYQKVPIGDIPIEHTFNKIIILCSDGFQDSDLDELVNYSWEAGSLEEPLSQAPLKFNLFDSEYIKNLGSGDSSELILDSKSGVMSNVVPAFTGILPNNYDTKGAFDVGCNFIAVNYNLTNELDETYKKMFKNYSFVLKPIELRQVNKTISYNAHQNPNYDMTPKNINVNDPMFAKGLTL